MWWSFDVAVGWVLPSPLSDGSCPHLCGMVPALTSAAWCTQCLLLLMRASHNGPPTPRASATAPRWFAMGLPVCTET